MDKYSAEESTKQISMMTWVVGILVCLSLTSCGTLGTPVLADIPKVMRGATVDDAIAVLGKPNYLSVDKYLETHSVTYFRSPIQVQVYYTAKTRALEDVYVSNMVKPAMDEKRLKGYAGLKGDTDWYWLETFESSETTRVRVVPGKISAVQKRARYLRSLPSDRFEVVEITIPHADGTYDGDDFQQQFDAIMAVLDEHGFGRMGAWAISKDESFDGYQYFIEVFAAAKAIPLFKEALRKVGAPKDTRVSHVNR